MEVARAGDQSIQQPMVLARNLWEPGTTLLFIDGSSPTTLTNFVFKTRQDRNCTVFH